MKIQKRLYNLILPLITVICITVIWAIAASVIDSEFILPTIQQTIKSFLGLFKSGAFYRSFLKTLLRSLIAFIISFLFAGVMAILSFKYDSAKLIIKPLISITRALPTIAVVLLLLLWTTSNIAPVVVTSLVILPTVYTDLTNSLETIDKKVVEMCKVFGVAKKDILFKVELPSVAPSIVSIIGAGLSLNLKLMVAAEVLSQTAVSIGLMLNTSKVYFETATMFALVLVTVLAGLIIEGIFGIIKKRAFKWQA